MATVIDKGFNRMTLAAHITPAADTDRVTVYYPQDVLCKHAGVTHDAIINPTTAKITTSGGDGTWGVRLTHKDKEGKDVSLPSNHNPFVTVHDIGKRTTEHTDSFHHIHHGGSNVTSTSFELEPDAHVASNADVISRRVGARWSGMTTDNILAGMHENKNPGSDGNYLVCPHAPDGTRSAVWELLKANAKGPFFEGRYPSSLLNNPKENINGIPAVSVAKADIEKAIGVLKPTLNPFSNLSGGLNIKLARIGSTAASFGDKKAPSPLVVTLELGRTPIDSHRGVMVTPVRKEVAMSSYKAAGDMPEVFTESTKALEYKPVSGADFGL